MKKTLAAVDVGGADVETVLGSETVRPGEAVAVAVAVDGGAAEQQVDAIELAVETSYRTAEGSRTATVDRVALTDGFTIEPDRSDTFETTVSIPYATPVTGHDGRVEIETVLETPGAHDTGDRDSLTVRPTDRMLAALDAARELGFSRHTVDVVADPAGVYVDRGFVQAFGFRAKRRPVPGDHSGLTLRLDPGPAALTVYPTVDGPVEASSDPAGDPTPASFSVTTADAAEVADRLRETLERLG